MNRNLPVPFILFILALTCWRCAPPDEVPRPNIVWIVCEDISPFLSCYGDEVVKTPNIDQLAKEGIRYTHVFTTAGVCAPSRSAIITGMYQTSIGTHNMRTLNSPAAQKYSNGLNYSAVVPDYVKCFPEYLRKDGYYCTNNEKQDYQFIPPVTVWDENGPAASWKNRPEGAPFFSVFNLAITHESQLMGRKDSLRIDPASVKVPPFYPDTKTVRHDIARLLTNIEMMDENVGEIIAMLKADGLYDNTIIFFYSDHGGALPWMKREVLERGIHIPMIIRFPGMTEAGTTNDEMISSVDFAPTVLSLAKVKVPDHMQGQAFLGDQKASNPRKYAFAGRDRMDTEYDRVRAVRGKRFEYLYNYMPEKPYYQEIEYRRGIPMMRELLALRDAGQLAPEQMAWFGTKPVEEFYDLEKDPDQMHNLIDDPSYQEDIQAFRTAFQQWTKKVGDQGATPEKELLQTWWDGKDEPPVTATPKVVITPTGIQLTCKTKGASIGYRICPKTPLPAESHVVATWDFGSIFNPNLKNGQERPAEPVWQVYKGQPIKLEEGDTLKVNAMRIGYQPATIEYVH